MGEGREGRSALSTFLLLTSPPRAPLKLVEERIEISTNLYSRLSSCTPPKRVSQDLNPVLPRELLERALLLRKKKGLPRGLVKERGGTSGSC